MLGNASLESANGNLLDMGTERSGVQFVEEVDSPGGCDFTQPTLDMRVSPLIGQTLV